MNRAVKVTKDGCTTGNRTFASRLAPLGQAAWGFAVVAAMQSCNFKTGVIFWGITPKNFLAAFGFF
jgi:hypothetical protein